MNEDGLYVTDNTFSCACFVLYLRLSAFICVHLRSSAFICVHLRSSADKNTRDIENKQPLSDAAVLAVSSGGYNGRYFKIFVRAHWDGIDS